MWNTKKYLASNIYQDYTANQNQHHEYSYNTEYVTGKQQITYKKKTFT